MLSTLRQRLSASMSTPVAHLRGLNNNCAGMCLLSAKRWSSQSQAESSSSKVQYKETTHELTFVENIDKIDDGPSAIFRRENVPAYELSNSVGMTVTAMAEGGNMVQLNKNGVDYIWDNKEGACYYGDNKNAFPLNRGLILHGGVRFAAVCAEHGVYYDSQWNVKINDSNPDEMSIVLSISDTQEQRSKIKDPFSVGQFNKQGDDPNIDSTLRLTKYPVTNLIFTYTITLRANEEFVRLNMCVENPSDKDCNAEAWLPMTYPIEQDSQIISPQKYRWRRDEWCFKDQPNIVQFADGNKDLHYPLKWQGSGIYYDWPSMEGGYHGVNRPSTGQGTVYVTDKNARHFMKLWSWGDKDCFDRTTADALAKGRPATEYYEPWGSAFNFAFFQSATFKAHSINEWNAAILPIESGLIDTHNEKLQQKVEQEIKKHGLDKFKSPSTMY